MKDGITVISALVSTCVFFWSFNIVYSHVAGMLNTFSRVRRELTLFLVEFVTLVALKWPWVGFTFKHFCKKPHVLTDNTFLVQSRTKLATERLTWTSFTQMTIAFSTSELFIRFPEGLFEVISHFFLHHIRFNTCWRTRKSHCLTSDF